MSRETAIDASHTMSPKLRIHVKNFLGAATDESTHHETLMRQTLAAAGGWDSLDFFGAFRSTSHACLV